MTSADGRKVPYTLDQADANISESIGRPAGLADAVRKLADVKAAAKALSDRRAAVFADVKRLHDQGMKAVRTGSGDKGWFLKPKVTPASTVRRVYSSDVFDADPALWQRCKVVKRSLSVAAPKSYTPADLGVRLPALPYRGASAGAVVDAYKSKSYTEQLAWLKDQEAEARSAIEKVAAEIGWDGETQEFTDGWAVTLMRPEFSGDRLKALDPDAYMRLSKVVDVAEKQTLMVVDLEHAVTTGEVEMDELDEIDGE